MKKYIFLASVLSALTLPAMADGFYFLGDVGQGRLEADNGDNTIYRKNSTSYSLGVGYDANQFIAVEIAYRDLGSVNNRYDYGGGDLTVSELDLTAFQASVLGKIPVSNVVNVYGRLGVSKLSKDWSYTDFYSDGYVQKEDGSESATKGLIGIGASYNITPQVALRAEYTQFEKWQGATLSSFTIGATYSF